MHFQGILPNTCRIRSYYFGARFGAHDFLMDGGDIHSGGASKAEAIRRFDLATI
jgi:hypothetical protein